MIKTSVADAKARLSEYLERAEQGERIVICRHNKPVAELGPVGASRTEPRPLGPLSGRPTFSITPVFFEPLSDREIDAWEGTAIPGMAGAASTSAARTSRVAEKKGSYRVPAKPGTGRPKTRS